MHIQYIAEKLNKVVTVDSGSLQGIAGISGVTGPQGISGLAEPGWADGIFVSGLTGTWDKGTWMSEYAEQHSKKELPVLEDFQIINDKKFLNDNEWLLKDYFPTLG